MEISKEFSLPHFCYSSSVLKGCLENANNFILDIFQCFPESLWDAPTIGPCPLWLLNNLVYYQEEYLMRPLGELGLAPQYAYNRYHNSLADIHRQKEMDFAQTRHRLNSISLCMDHYLSSKEADYKDTIHVLNAVFFADRLSEELATYLNFARLAPPEKSVADYGIGGKPLGDVQIPGGKFILGVPREDLTQAFYYDNEVSGAAVLVKPFSISKAVVTNAEYLEFVLAGGYLRADYWSYEGFKWLLQQDIKRPTHFANIDGQWYEKFFNEVYKLRENHPIVNISWYEAAAYCQWRKRRLPTEIEWEMAAATAPNADGPSLHKTKFPWGDTPLKQFHSNLSWVNTGTMGVGNFPKSDSAWGLAQMIGNVWEWTASTFYPYPGFTIDRLDPDYSTQMFSQHKVARGGSFATRSRLMRNTYRHGLRPDQLQAFVGFRTCQQ